MGFKSHTIRPALLLFVLLAVVPVLVAQSASCPAIVQAALDVADQLCQPTGRNQACYGNISLVADAQPGASMFKFDDAGDIVDVSLLHSLRTMPLDVETGTWGIAILRLQANLPATLPGQNVTFLLFGDAEITTAEDDSAASDDVPMKAFYLRSAIGDSLCDEAPESGLLVQTPEGASEITFNINGIDVSMGSTVLFRAQADGEMTVSTLEGSAFLEGEDETVPVLAGTRARVPVNAQLRAQRNQLSEPEPYDLRRLGGLPVRLLQRQIDINRPLTAAEVRELQRRLVAGEAICGEEPFPSCDKVPRLALIRSLRQGREGLEDRLDCVFRRYPGEEPLPETETRPFCDTLPPAQLPCQFVPQDGEQPRLPRLDRRPYCPQLPPAPIVATVDESTPDDNRDAPVNEAVDQVNDTVDEVVDGVNETVGEVVDSVDQTVDEVVDQVNDTVNEAVDRVDETVDDAVDEVSETVDDVVDKVDETVDEVLDKTLRRLPLPVSRGN
ncbi:MAG: hypothetical protein K8L99_11610 [Anaerolineae bacterium]|nr:hypothetical protein [Anaerolineae bacterium]